MYRMRPRMCRICNSAEAGSYSPHCQPCHAAKLAGSEQRRKWSIRATAVVTRAVMRGDLPSLRTNAVACWDCGSRASVYEHRDYTKPLVVEPVCRRCNAKRGPGATPGVDFDRRYVDLNDNNIGAVRARMQLPEIERTKVRKDNSG